MYVLFRFIKSYFDTQGYRQLGIGKKNIGADVDD